MYHRHVCSKKTFSYVDSAIHNAIWQWAKRRHPKKNAHWVWDRYFISMSGPNGGANWTFFGEVEGSNGKLYKPFLIKASRIPIRRHVKIRADVNPYDPCWAKYLMKRHERQIGQSAPTWKET